ncbi:ATP-dependent RecD-like DNA helicase [Hujiaoplasma nucleasis]|uniref:ATP-dependent RecD2 DNA helicase n=1 Tax=Hujiaoplasma nucleasis TaxID=2725268 RepID=A0A7L6N1J9_9MOLU|nr:ATP-dependent RecD-like DNA helicase [Hujiaoplasma nucleasis]QLY39451.1 ATP-dependent RecD-like DNA helicase [Hujiaoplasma nucleasis]
MTYVEGTIKRYLFYSEENSYSVIKVEIQDTNNPELIRYEPTIVVCGFFPKLDLHASYKFMGEIAYHKTYGLQFNAKTFERYIDETYDGIIDYLSSDIFPGVGVKTAERIVDTLGMNCLDLIAEDKDQLKKVDKLNKKLHKIIFDGIVGHREMENTLVWLYGFSISPNMAMKIYNKYGLETKQIIKENPYVLMEEVEGIGFKRADEIGLKVGFAYDSDVRISAVIYYLLNEYMNKFGDTYLLEEELIKYTLQFLNNHEDFEVDEQKVIKQLFLLIESHKLIKEEDRIFLRYLYYAEKSIAKMMLKFNINSDVNLSVDDHLQAFKSINHINYTQAQRKAIHLALTNHVSIITGGPGTGKTTVIKGLIHVYRMMRNQALDDEDLKLAAPTGKAAKRLSESTDLPASTIHKLLGYDFNGEFKYDEFSPLEAKLVIIDEASMIDCILMKKLLSAIKVGTILVFVGDANQLPSVGPGDVLNDLIKSDLFPVQELNIIHRQANDSNIISLAYDVLEKQIDESIRDNKDDRLFFNAKDEYISSTLLKLIDRLIQKNYSLLEDIQVLVPMYKGINGIDRLNDLIQETFNGDNKNLSLSFGDKKFYFQDKVMQLVNQPDKNVMNGDQGFVVAIDDEREMVVDFSGQLVKYNRKELDQLTLAYVTSIHKSQGSEYKVVIMPLTLSYSIMLRKKLLYTAITRAKEILIMVGNFEAFKRGVLGKDRKRRTMLKNFLTDELNQSPSNQVKIEDFLNE